MELIGRDVLSKEMCEKCGKKDCTGITDTEICIAQLVICSQNSVDAVPVVHGHWINVEPSDEYSYCKVICSECGIRAGKHKTLYCPHCGAKMDGKVEDDSN